MIGNDGLLSNPGMANLFTGTTIRDIGTREVIRVATVANLPAAGPPYEGVLATVAGGGSSSASAGPNSPGTLANDASIGTIAWSNPSNAASSNNSYATAALDGESTQYLKATNFGFSLSSGTTITGIEVAAECSLAVGSIVTEITEARIVKGGVIGTTNLPNGTDFTTTDTYLTMGGATSLWGETWSYSDINASTFGVAISVSASSGGCIAQIDHVRITVYYTSPGASGDTYRCNRLSNGTYAWEVVAAP